MPLTLAQQARIAKKKQDALDRKRQKEAERDAKRRRHEEQEAAAPAAAPEVPRGLRAHNGVGLREAPLHARRRSVPVRRFSAETPDEEPAEQTPSPAAPPGPPADVAPQGAPPAAASAPAPAPAIPPAAGSGVADRARKNGISNDAQMWRDAGALSQKQINSQKRWGGAPKIDVNAAKKPEKKFFGLF